MAQVRQTQKNAWPHIQTHPLSHLIQTIIQPILAKLCQFAGFKVCCVNAATRIPLTAGEDCVVPLCCYLHHRLGWLGGGSQFVFIGSVSSVPGKLVSACFVTLIPLTQTFQGIGAGGIITVVWTILTKLVHPEDRSRWQPFLSVTWALSAAAGPLLGGFFSGMIIGFCRI